MQEGENQFTEEQLEEAALFGTPLVADSTVNDTPVIPLTPESTPASEQSEEKEEEIFDINKPVNLWEETIQNDSPPATPEFEQEILKRYSKYNVNSLDELEAKISGLSDDSKEVSELKAQLDMATRNASPFTNDAERKLFDFVKGYDGKNLNAISEFRTLQGLEIESMSAKDALMEAFIFENKRISRTEATKLFEIRYKREFGISDLEPEFDAEKIEERKLEEKFAALNAKEKLAKMQSEFKPDLTPVTQQAAESVSMEIVTKNVNAAAEFSKTLNLIKVATGNGEGHSFNVVLPADKMEAVSNALKAWTSNPVNYDSKGNFQGPKEYNQMADMLMYGILGKDFVKTAFNMGKQIKQNEYVDQKKVLKGQTPIGVGGATSSDGLSSEQMEELAIMQRK